MIVYCPYRGMGGESRLQANTSVCFFHQDAGTKLQRDIGTKRRTKKKEM
jgi:hypothetical protein